MEIENKGMNQGTAVSLEMLLRKEYQCDRHGLGGIINSDHIRHRKGAFYHCMAMLLVKFYTKENATVIDDFLQKHDGINEKKMDEMNTEKNRQIYEELADIYHKLVK